MANRSKEVMFKNIKLPFGNASGHLATLTIAKARNINSNPRIHT